ncbi:PaeR7I family type II restriction endonuclease [Streptosporangium sp. NPDC049376]|uniref:PaeR7I family type II restriction endonuclease n=1 Tax=Streptosporangium sp. NPDC049376 TaxID=3366192 RepID=UPI003799F19A
MDYATKIRIDAALQRWVELRDKQKADSTASGRAQAGNRAAVTAGNHLSGINQLIVDEVASTGATGLEIVSSRSKTTLAGFYRASKAWDLLVLEQGSPVLAVEYKTMKGSEGKNLNNRADEVFGVAEDARQAEARGLLSRDLRRAYVFVMGITPESVKPVGISVSYGEPDAAFQGASYLRRTAIMCKRMRDTGLYHLTWAVGVQDDPFLWQEPDPEVGWDRFAADLRAAFPGGTPTIAPHP